MIAFFIEKSPCQKRSNIAFFQTVTKMIHHQNLDTDYTPRFMPEIAKHPPTQTTMTVKENSVCVNKHEVN